jgi:uncharacterized peroxidase-related enzyme
MPRLSTPTRDQAPAASQPLLDAVKRQLGIVPNLYRVVANSPAALAALTGLGGALGKTLDVRSRERVALAVAEVNGCDYCLSAHSYLALNLAKLPAGEVELARKGASNDPKAAALARFAAEVTRSRGHVTDADLAAVRGAGYGDAEIVEIVALVAENVFTNFVNSVAETEIDFPIVRARAA